MQSEAVLDVVKPEVTDLLQLSIRDKVSLHSHYMPFIKHGGIFIPTDRTYQFGETIGMVLRFLDRGKKLVITGKVVWVSPRSSNHNSHNPGVGLQFVGNTRQDVQKAIEAYLGDLAKRPALHQAY
ncbi:MAG: PilZ domain-containing protein [Thiotrichaceae bacterium]